MRKWFSNRDFEQNDFVLVSLAEFGSILPTPKVISQERSDLAVRLASNWNSSKNEPCNFGATPCKYQLKSKSLTKFLTKASPILSQICRNPRISQDSQEFQLFLEMRTTMLLLLIFAFCARSASALQRKQIGGICSTQSKYHAADKV